MSKKNTALASENVSRINGNAILAPKYNVVIEKLQALLDAQNANSPVSVIDSKKSDLKDALAEYNGAAERIAYEEWGDLLTAATALYIPLAISATTSKDSKTGKYTASVKPANQKLSIRAMHEQLGAGIFENPRWYDRTTTLALLYADALNKDLTKGAEFTYSVDIEDLKEFAFGEANPHSKTSMVKGLQKTIDGILFVKSKNSKGEPVNAIKVDGRDWTYIVNALTAQGSKPGQIKIKNLTKFNELIMDCVYVRLNGGNFELVNG